MQEFLKSVDLLTIYEENRLKKQVAALKEQNKDNEYNITGKLQEKDKQIQDLIKKQDETEKKFQLIFTKIDTGKL